MKKLSDKKAKLIELSQIAKQMRDNNAPEIEDMIEAPTINNIILHCFYPKGEYNTYKGWKEKGYQVAKGSKAFSIWGKKRKFKKEVENKGKTEEKEYSAFPMANLFHESQVEAIEEEAEVA